MYKYINCNGETLINCEQVIAYCIEQEYEGAETFEVNAMSHGSFYTLYSGCNHEQATEVINIIQEFLLDGSTHVLEIKGNQFIRKERIWRYKAGK